MNNTKIENAKQTIKRATATTGAIASIALGTAAPAVAVTPSPRGDERGPNPTRKVPSPAPGTPEGVEQVPPQPGNGPDPGNQATPPPSPPKETVPFPVMPTSTDVLAAEGIKAPPSTSVPVKAAGPLPGPNPADRSPGTSSKQEETLPRAGIGPDPEPSANELLPLPGAPDGADLLAVEDPPYASGGSKIVVGTSNGAAVDKTPYYNYSNEFRPNPGGVAGQGGPVDPSSVPVIPRSTP